MFAHKCRNSNSRGHLCLQGISCSLGNRYSKYVFYGGVPMNVCRDFNWFLPIFYLETASSWHARLGSLLLSIINEWTACFISKCVASFLVVVVLSSLKLADIPFLFFPRWAWAFDMEMLLFSSNTLRNMLWREIVSTLPKLGKCHAGEGVEEVYHWQLQSR